MSMLPDKQEVLVTEPRTCRDSVRRYDRRQVAVSRRFSLARQLCHKCSRAHDVSIGAREGLRRADSWEAEKAAKKAVEVRD
jgi:hypothetical protein